jgi:hypothetical protein
MDTGIEQILPHHEPLAPDPGALLADLQSGLDALQSLLSEIAAREQQLELETLRSILSQFDMPEQQRHRGSS